MDPNRFNRQQLLELVGQILGHIRLSTPAPGRAELDAGPPAIQGVEDGEETTPLTIEKVLAEEPIAPAVLQVQLRRPRTQQLLAVLVDCQDSAGKGVCGEPLAVAC